MGFFRSTGKLVKPLVNVPRWMHFDRLSAQGQMTFQLLKGLFTPEASTRTESFEQAIQRMGLTESALARRKKQLLRLAIIFGIITVVVLLYALFHFSQGNIKAGFVSSVIAGIAFTQFFRNHLWYTQIKYRTLGLNFKQWFFVGILGRPL